jgi:hypothetical protein
MSLTERYVSSTGSATYANSTNPVTPMSLTTALANAVAGDRINVKADGIYTRTASDTAVGIGSVTSPIIYRGYLLTPGDGFQGRTGANGALVLSNMPVIAYDDTFRLTLTAFTIFESITLIANLAATSAALTTGTDCLIIRSNIDNAGTGTGTSAIQLTARAVIFDCDVMLSNPAVTAAAINGINQHVRVLCSRIKGGVGITTSSGTPIIVGNVIYACSGNGIVTTAAGGAITAVGNTIVGNATGINIIAASTVLHCIVGNMLTDHSAYGVNFNTPANAGFFAYNRPRDNASGDINLGIDWTAATRYGDVTTDTGGPETDYVDAGANDYKLISTSLAKGMGWFPFRDIGALQREESAEGGGGAAVFNPLGQSIITAVHGT